MTRSYQLGREAFRSICLRISTGSLFRPSQPRCVWRFSWAIPLRPGLTLSESRAPGGTKLMPHRHPEDRIYTVMSGVFYIGLGDHFDGDKVKAFPPGSVVVLPGNTSHFHWAKSGEYVTQITAIGPLGLEYVDPADDPRRCHDGAC